MKCSQTEAEELEKRLNELNLGHLLESEQDVSLNMAAVAYILCSEVDDRHIKKNYRQLALLFHPDRDPQGKFEREMKVLNFVWECLEKK